MTVKSAYGFIEENIGHVQNIKASTSSEAEMKVWMSIWNLKFPAKIQNFLWRAASNSLAVGWNLTKRRMCTDGRCRFCGEAQSVNMFYFFVNGLDKFGLEAWDCRSTSGE